MTLSSRSGSGFATQYKFCDKLGLTIHAHPQDGRVLFIPFKELRDKLNEANIAETFSELFGVQTITDLGPYPWDVEATLELIFTGHKTGSQLLWD